MKQESTFSIWALLAFFLFRNYAFCQHPPCSLCIFQSFPFLCILQPFYSLLSQWLSTQLINLAQMRFASERR